MPYSPDEHWWHELRNALGNTIAALMVADAELADEHFGLASEFIREACAACEAALALLDQHQD